MDVCRIDVVRILRKVTFFDNLTPPTPRNKLREKIGKIIMKRKKLLLTHLPFL